MIDRELVRAIHLAAFGRPEEADLIERLRAEGAVLLELVHDNCGHICFSRMWIDERPAVALAPMAVLPERQRQGVGSALVRAGLNELAARGERVVLVLGHPEYYPRFGFSAEKAKGLEGPFAGPAWMALELVPGAIQPGRVRWAEAFGLE